MNYTLFAVGCYVGMRALQVLCEGSEKVKWVHVLIKVVGFITLYAALASVIVWYKEIPFLGFEPSN